MENKTTEDAQHFKQPTSSLGSPSTTKPAKQTHSKADA